MKPEQFLYAPEPDKGLQFHQTSGVYNLVPEDLIIKLQNLPITSQPIRQIHQTPKATLITVSFVEKAKDSHARDTIRNHTYIFTLNQIVDWLTGQLEPRKGEIADVFF